MNPSSLYVSRYIGQRYMLLLTADTDSRAVVLIACCLPATGTFSIPMLSRPITLVSAPRLSVPMSRCPRCCVETPWVIIVAGVVPKYRLASYPAPSSFPLRLYYSPDSAFCAPCSHHSTLTIAYHTFVPPPFSPRCDTYALIYTRLIHALPFGSSCFLHHLLSPFRLIEPRSWIDMCGLYHTSLDSGYRWFSRRRYVQDLWLKRY